MFVLAGAAVVISLIYLMLYLRSSKPHSNPPAVDDTSVAF
jgi:hypothetical protein